MGGLTLNRPDTLNAWTPEFGRDLKSVIQGEAAERVRSLRADHRRRSRVLLGGGPEGPASTPTPTTASRTSARSLHELYHPVIAGVRRLPKPVVAAVNGPAVGIGCSLALACDLILVARVRLLRPRVRQHRPDARRRLDPVRPAAVGKARAFQMALLGERVSTPQQSAGWGLVNSSHHDDRLMGEAEALVEHLAKGPTRSYASPSGRST